MKKNNPCILIISNKNPFTYTGGVEIVVNKLAKGLSKFFKIYIICTTNKSKQKVFKGGIEVFFITKGKIPLISDIRYALKIRKLTNRLNPSLTIDNGCLSFLNNTSRSKIISIAHGTNQGNYKSITINHPKDLFSKIYRYFWVLVQKYYLKRCNKIIAISERIKNEIVQYYKIKDSHIEVINNGTFIDLSTSDIKEILNKKIEKNIIFVSTDHRWKGIEIIEKIAEQLKEYHFFVCGYPYKSNLPNISYEGLLSETDLKRLMKKSDCFILPSKYEGQSLALLDALAMGLPVIISRNSDPSIIKNNINGFLVGRDVNSFINTIRSLYKNLNNFKKIKKNNIMLMKQYTWDIQIEKYLKIIFKVINNKII